MSVVDRLKVSFEDTKESYEASAAMVLCLAIAVCFALVAGAIWLAAFVGALAACGIFCGIFLLLAFGCWAVGRAKANHAKQNLDAAKQSVTSSVRAVSNTVESLTSGSAKSAGTLDAVMAGALLLVLLYLGGRKTAPWDDHSRFA